MKIYKTVILTVIITTLLLSCFSNFTNEDDVPFENSFDFEKNAVYELTLTATNGLSKVIIYRLGDVIEIERGLWKIEVRELKDATYNKFINNYYGHDPAYEEYLFKDGDIKTYIGETTAEVWSGTLTNAKIIRDNDAIPPVEVEVNNWAQLLAVARHEREATITLKEGTYEADIMCVIIDAEITLIPDGDVTININYPIGTLATPSASGIFYIGDGVFNLGKEGMTGTLTIDGNKDELDPDVRTDFNKNIIRIEGGELKMHEGITLTNSTDSAVYIREGIFDMYGGEIKNNGYFTSPGININTKFGGGVYINAGGNFHMYNGIISGNKAERGGGVYVDGGTTSSYATFTMHDGKITDNIAYGYAHSSTTGDVFPGDGGGVYVDAASNPDKGYDYYSGGIFTMNNGEITNNKAYNGCGVYVASSRSPAFSTIPEDQEVQSGTFKRIGGTISGNIFDPETYESKPGNGKGVFVGGEAKSSNGGTFLAATFDGDHTLVDDGVYFEPDEEP